VVLSRSATAAGMSGSMGIKTAALDPFRGYANAIRDELPAQMPARRRRSPSLPDPTDQPCLNAKGGQWLHVDYEAHLTSFYREACGFNDTEAGLLKMT
jgi:hypothetical protein